MRTALTATWTLLIGMALLMLGAGLLARNAAARGLKPAPWVKTSLGPGSLVVTDYLKKAGLLDDLETLGFHVVGYGCTTCIGNSGPLPEEVSRAIAAGDLAEISRTLCAMATPPAPDLDRLRARLADPAQREAVALLQRSRSAIRC